MRSYHWRPSDTKHRKNCECCLVSLFLSGHYDWSEGSEIYLCSQNVTSCCDFNVSVNSMTYCQNLENSLKTVLKQILTNLLMIVKKNVKNCQICLMWYVSSNVFNVSKPKWITSSTKWQCRLLICPQTRAGKNKRILRKEVAVLCPPNHRPQLPN